MTINSTPSAKPRQFRAQVRHTIQPAGLRSGRLRFIDLVGLTHLVRAGIKARDRRRLVMLTVPRREPGRTLELTGMASMFPMPSSVEEAAYGTAMPSSSREMFGLRATGSRDASGTAGERAGSTGTSSPPNSGERAVMESANSNSENLAARDQSTGDLIRQLSEQVSRLVRDEVKVAQLEMTRKGKQAGLGIGLSGGSGLIALYGVACLLAAAVVALSGVVAAWLAALITGACCWLSLQQPRWWGKDGCGKLRHRSLSRQ